MDILISSNLERLIYRLTGSDAARNAAYMESLAANGAYTVTPEMKAGLSDFYGNFADETETAQQIQTLYRETGYITDTHTAVAAAVYAKYKADTKDTDTKAVIASTASPFKFTRSVMEAVDREAYHAMTDFELADELGRLAKTELPQAIEEIRSAAVRHDTVCEPEEMERAVRTFLKLR